MNLKKLLLQGKMNDFAKEYLNQFEKNSQTTPSAAEIIAELNLSYEDLLKFKNEISSNQKFKMNFLEQLFSNERSSEEEKFILHFLYGLEKYSSKDNDLKNIFNKLKQLIEISFTPDLYSKFIYENKEILDKEKQKLVEALKTDAELLKANEKSFNGVISINKEEQKSLTSKTGVSNNFVSNGLSNQYIVEDYFEKPESVLLSSAQAFLGNGAGGLSHAFWRGCNRIISNDSINFHYDYVENAYDYKRLVAIIASKRLEIYNTKFSNEPLPSELVKLIKRNHKRFSDYFSLRSWVNYFQSSSTPTKPLVPLAPQPIPLLPDTSIAPPPLISSLHDSFTNLPIIQNPSSIFLSNKTDSFESIGSISDEEEKTSIIEAYDSSATSSPTIDEDFIESIGSTPSSTPPPVLLANEKVEILNKYTNLQSEQFKFTIEVVRHLKDKIAQVKHSNYSSESIQNFINEIKRIQKNNLVVDFKSFMHEVVFKSTTHKKKLSRFWQIQNLWKENSSRGSLHGQILQIANNAQSLEDKKSLLNLIETTNLNQSANKFISHNLNLDSFDKISDELLQNTKWKDRDAACLTIEKLCSSVIHSNLSVNEKKFYLDKLESRLTYNLGEITENISKKRKLFRSESVYFTLGYQAYNFSRFLKPLKKGILDPIISVLNTVIPCFIFPINSMLSKTQTTTQNSVINMIKGAKQLIELQKNGTKNLEDRNKKSPQLIQNRIMSLINREKDKLFSAKDFNDLKQLIKEAKSNHSLMTILQSKSNSKNYTLFDITNKLTSEQTHEIQRIIYSFEELFPKQTKIEFLEKASAKHFSQFFANEISKLSKSSLENGKMEISFTVSKISAYLSHLSQIINDHSHGENKYEEKYEECHHELKEYLNGAINDRSSSLRKITQIRSRPHILFMDTLGKIVGRGFTTIVTPIVKVAIFGSVAAAVIAYGAPAIIGFMAISLALYAIRLALSSFFDNDYFYHSKKTKSYLYVCKIVDNLKKKENSNITSKIKNEYLNLTVKNKMIKLNKIIHANNNSHSKEQIEDNFEKAFGSMQDEIKFAHKINEKYNLSLDKEYNEDIIQSIFNEILVFSKIQNRNTHVCKSFLTREAISLIFLASKINLKCKTSKDISDFDNPLFALIQKEMQDNKTKEKIEKEKNKKLNIKTDNANQKSKSKESNLAHVCYLNSFAQERNFFSGDATVAVYCIPGLISSIFLSPIGADGIGIWIANELVTSLGYPLKDIAQLRADNNASSFGSTTTYKTLNSIMKKLDEQQAA
jgi:hypothetical protein